MNIDWITLAAQIINFLILLALLKKFLFDRIVKVMDEREQRIADRLQEARSKKDEADKELQQYQQKNEDFEQKRRVLMEEAKNESEQQKKELIQEARNEVDSMRSIWHRSIENEKESFLKDLRRRSGEEVYSVARRVLKDLSDKRIEEQIISIFADRLKNLGSDEKKELNEMIQKSNNDVGITTSFEVNNDLQKKIDSAIKEHISDEAKVEYRTSEKLICGIEMRVDGKKVAWNIDSYLDALEASFQNLISKEVKKTETNKKKEKSA
ncbi:F0F1 ATP synthase subunit B [candidate division KSB1 bacterium]|nr:F0F1 ATP synthase subunit B [candidate division KSB1 bacterium]